MSKVVLECNHLEKRIKERCLVNDISFRVCEGDIMGFIGPNGAGKTSTIKLILGLYKMDCGSVSICGYDLSKDYAKAIRNVGAIIESPDMYMYMSGYDNLLLCCKLYHINKNKISEVVGLVNLQNRIYDKVSKYSLGMRQRLGIAQALLHDPKLLILDEPTNGLDPEGIMELKRLIVDLANRGMAIIVSSHILLELESFCNRVCVINKGCVISNTSVDELINLSNNGYILEVNDVNVNKYISKYSVIDSNHIRINSFNGSLNDIIKNLIDNNIGIYEIKRDVLSLEDVFMSLVGGNTIDQVNIC